MQYRYQLGEQEYVVRPLNDILEGDSKVEVEFIVRINGGKGRMPKTKEVSIESLEPLVDFETAKKLIKQAG